jgi:hypothetical protein
MFRQENLVFRQCSVNVGHGEFFENFTGISLGLPSD